MRNIPFSPPDISQAEIDEVVKVVKSGWITALRQQVEDTATVLDQYEATHSEYEADQSVQYGALVEGHFAIKEAIDKINNQLNKK